MKKKRFVMLTVLCAFLVIPALALADSLTPASYSDTLEVGESVTISKTFTVDKMEELAADVLFLFDTTGSVGSAINIAKSAAENITSGLDAALGDVRFGVAHYEDFYEGYESKGWGGSGDVPYGSVTSLGDASSAISGINSLTLGNGYDWREANLYALQQAAETTEWRDTAAHFIVWLGDAPSHDPGDTPGYPGPTLDATITSLTDVGAMVMALNYGALDYDGEATAVTDATGGGLYSGTTDPGEIVTQIVNGISGFVENYSQVSLDVIGDHAGVDVSIYPSLYDSDDYDRNATRTFSFDVTFTGVAPGTYEFTIRGLVDGVATAFESDHITVGTVPEPTTILLLGTGIFGLAGFRRNMFKKS